MIEVAEFLRDTYHLELFVVSLIIAICEVTAGIAALSWFAAHSSTQAKSSRQIRFEVKEQAASWRNWRKKKEQLKLKGNKNFWDIVADILVRIDWRAKWPWI